MVILSPCGIKKNRIECCIEIRNFSDATGLEYIATSQPAHCQLELNVTDWSLFMIIQPLPWPANWVMALMRPKTHTERQWDKADKLCKQLAARTAIYKHKVFLSLSLSLIPTRIISIFILGLSFGHDIIIEHAGCEATALDLPRRYVTAFYRLTCCTA